MLDDKKFLIQAIKQAKKSVAFGGFPAGAVLVMNGKVVAKGVAVGSLINDPTAHPEISMIRKVCKKLKTTSLAGTTLYASLECCNMCFQTSYWAGITRIVYASRKTPALVKKFYYEGSTSNSHLNKSNNRQIELVFVSELEKESLAVVRTWEEKNNV